MPPLSNSNTRPFIVCIHDATPRYARETQAMIRDLSPLVGRRLSFGVVPDWHGEWPLTAHPHYCRLVQDSSEELLLHGYHHRRERGWGAVSWLTAQSDEMNGLDRAETRRALERGQHVFTEAFGEPARGFLAPAWQPGHVRTANLRPKHPRSEPVCTEPELPEPLHAEPLHLEPAHPEHPHPEHLRRDDGPLWLEHVVGFFSIQSATGRSVPLATWTWDCGRWGWLGHVGHGIGSLLHQADRRVPVLAIHPGDLERGFWRGILRLARDLLERGYEPGTMAGLLASSDPGRVASRSRTSGESSGEPFEETSGESSVE